MLRPNLRWLCGSELLTLSAVAAFLAAFVPDPLPYLLATAGAGVALGALSWRRAAREATPAA